MSSEWVGVVWVDMSALRIPVSLISIGGTTVEE
jgi:hypothetical protein